jgi:ribosomal protein S18 acetylase RimI-like enzyme
MTAAELDEYLRTAIGSYADEHVAAGDWTPEEAEERSAAEFAQLLPAGVETENMLLYMAETGDGEVVGWVWLCSKHPRGPFAWVYDIEVVAAHRGKGYGRALLAAAEAELRQRGIAEVALHVFGHNVVAQGLYASSGYELMSQQFRKAL